MNFITIPWKYGEVTLTKDRILSVNKSIVNDSESYWFNIKDDEGNIENYILTKDQYQYLISLMTWR